MLFEIVTTSIMGGIAVKAFLKQKGIVTNDSGKIQRIMSLSGLNVKDGKDTLTTQLISTIQHEWGWEYKYRIPLGRSFNDYLSKIDAIQDGLNNRRRSLTVGDLKQLKLDKNILNNIRDLQEKKLKDQKEVEIEFDGLLKIRVYDEPLPKKVAFVPGDGWKVPIGLTRNKNEFRFHDFEKIPHFVLGGATRYGKSNVINVIINSLLQSEPDNVHFFLIDLKGGVELCDYENIKQVDSIAYEPEEALKTLETAYNRMKEIQKELKRRGKKKVQEANIKDRYFIIVDEVGELNPSEAIDNDEKKLKLACQKYMSQIARLGAGLGFRLIVATQYPLGTVVNNQIKQNADAKLCFRVQSEVASRVVLDSGGAEKLPQIVGRAIYQTADKREILQTPLITEEIIKETTLPHIIEKEEHREEAIVEEGRSDSLTFEEA